MKSYTKNFLFFAGMCVVSVLLMWGYTSLQQVVRLSANDPQVALSQDLATLLMSSPNIHTLPIPAIFSRVTQYSHSPFMIIYDARGVVATTSLIGDVPLVPRGVLDYTKTESEDRFTWQPENGLRYAAVTRYFNSTTSEGYVLVARSLAETEKVESLITLFAAVAWAVSVALLVLVRVLV